MTNNTQYGPWIAFNPGDTPPDDDVIVQAQGVNDTRNDLDDREVLPSSYFAWKNIIAYRIVKQPLWGEVVFSGSLHDHFSLHPDYGFQNPDKTARVTMTTDDGLLIPGTYTGPDGATIKIEAL